MFNKTVSIPEYKQLSRITYFDIVSETGLSPRPEYYSGRGQRESDLSPTMVAKCYEMIKTGNGEKSANNFLTMVCSLNEISATAFLKGLAEFMKKPLIEQGDNFSYAIAKIAGAYASYGIGDFSKYDFLNRLFSMILMNNNSVENKTFINHLHDSLKKIRNEEITEFKKNIDNYFVSIDKKEYDKYLTEMVNYVRSYQYEIIDNNFNNVGFYKLKNNIVIPDGGEDDLEIEYLVLGDYSIAAPDGLNGILSRAILPKPLDHYSSGNFVDNEIPVFRDSAIYKMLCEKLGYTNDYFEYKNQIHVIEKTEKNYYIQMIADLAKERGIFLSPEEIGYCSFFDDIYILNSDIRLLELPPLTGAKSIKLIVNSSTTISFPEQRKGHNEIFNIDSEEDINTIFSEIKRSATWRKERSSRKRNS